MAHSAPNICVSSFKFSAADFRIVDMLSPSHPTHKLIIWSLKNSCPSCFAKSGMCCIIASLILFMILFEESDIMKQQRLSFLQRKTYLHLESFARSIIAGNKDCDSKLTPITSFKEPREEITFNRTSEVVSRRSNNTCGTKSEIVASFPSKGARSVATIASAALTFSLSSSVSAFTFFTRRLATDMRGRFDISSLLVDLELAGGGQGTTHLHFATAAKFSVAAVLTSASGSCKSFSYAGTKISMAYVPSKSLNASITCANLDPTVHRTLQERSSIVAAIKGTIFFTSTFTPSILSLSADLFCCSNAIPFPNAIQFSVV
mmetsp:Transcript_10908/g.16356  ORF Transcript_10908/g.16356 Transcript_10908/m.16356 type:complete len:318 (-) Transcript_10908:911-1864(-)